MTPGEKQWCDDCQTHHAPPRGRPPGGGEPDPLDVFPGIITPLTHNPDGSARTEVPEAEEIPIPYMAATLNIPLPLDDEVRLILLTKNAYALIKLPTLMIVDKTQQIWWSNMIRRVLNQ